MYQSGHVALNTIINSETLTASLQFFLRRVSGCKQAYAWKKFTCTTKLLHTWEK